MSPAAAPSPADTRTLARLRALAAVALVAGGTISAGMLIRAGLRQHSSVFLIVLIGGWVVAPFAALGLAHAIAGRRAAQTRATLAVLSLVVSIGSPLIYITDAVDPLSAKAAAVYVLVPAIAWLFLAVGTLFAWAVGRRRT